MRKTVILLFSACCLSLAASAAIPVRWTTDCYRVKPLVYECYHGEMLDLSAALTAYGEPLDFSGKTARLYWQTNGMETAWWSTNAFVRAEAGVTNVLAAVWSGAYDTGAASVTGFIGVEGENYRAAFELRFRASPGFTPNQMPIQPQSIDWAKVANVNVESAPFALKGQGGVTTNAVRAIVEGYGYVTEAVTNGLATTNYVNDAVAGIVIPTGDRITTTNGLSTIYADGSWVTRTNATAGVAETNALCTVAAASAMTNDVTIVRWDENEAEGKKLKHGNTSVCSYNIKALPSDQNVFVEGGSIGVMNYIFSGTINSGPPAIYLNCCENYQLGSDLSERAWHYLRQGATEGDREIAVKADIPDAYTKTEADEAFATKAEQAATQAIVQTWEGFLDGSNVVFSITNYISGTYSLNEGKFKVLELTNGVYREVYDSRNEIVLHINNFKDNDFRTATNSVITSVDAKIADKADKAWGKYTSAGGEAPSNTVYMTAPNTVFAGGLEYERVAVGEGAVCVLTTKGAPTWTQGDEGTFKFQDDGGTNYFGFAKTDSYVIGCETDGISVQNHIVTLRYDITMSGVPCIWYKDDIASNVTWEQLNTPDGQPIAGASHVVSWEQNPPAGQEFCYINCPEEKGFFKATIEVAGEAKFMTNMPADLGGGIMCTNTATGVNGKIKPSFNGSSVIWTWSSL